MKLGLYLATQFRPGTDVRSQIANLVEQTKLAHRCNYASLWAAHHYLTAPLQMLQPVPLLAYLMPHAEGMLVGPNILVLPMLQPVHVAEESATLDVLSNGNYVFGVGLGYREEEFIAMNAPMKGRTKRFEEAIEICRRLWTEDKITYRSENYRIENLGIGLKPIRRGGPPVWIAAVVDAAVKRAAVIGDAWLITFYPTLQTLDQQMKLYRRTLTEVGKPEPADIPVLREAYVGQSRDAAYAECKDALQYKYKAYASWGQDRILSNEDRFDQPFEEFAKDRFFIGDKAYMREELHRYKETLRCNHFIMRFQWPGLSQKQVLNSIESLAEAVRDVR